MIISTKSNSYYLSSKKKESIILPSELKEIINNDGGYQEEPLEHTSYYKEKYQLLKENGYFDNQDFSKDRTARYTEEDIKYAISNAVQVVIETTERCNLNCYYCGYGELYCTHDGRSNNDLSFDKVEKLLIYLNKFWRSDINISLNKPVVFSFYGGEPLLNFNLIKETVEYIRAANINNGNVGFAITTNGLLIQKYIEFLVKWNFSVTVSLDGDLFSNSYRVFSNGKSSFNTVFDNLVYVRNNFREFFDGKIEFNSVFHHRVSIPNTKIFFKEAFGKIPMFLPLNSTGILPDKANDFLFLQTGLNSLNKDTQGKTQTQISERDLMSFLYFYSSSHYDEYNALRFNLSERIFPTGTCTPFLKKIYLSSTGKLLPCEKVAPVHSLGFVDERVSIDYAKVAAYYNKKFDKLEPSCNICANLFCQSCMLTVIDDENRCRKFLTSGEFHEKIRLCLSNLENSKATNLIDYILKGEK